MLPIGLFNWPALLSSGVASFVEMVEALTIVLAVSIVRGWKTAWAGAILAILVLAVIVGLGGPAIGHIDLQPLQVVIGTLLLLFGMRWLRKSILRAAGFVALHDESAAFEHEVEALKSGPQKMRYGIDLGGAATAFNGVLVEGIEVVFIVIAVGSTARRLSSAATGAGLALLLVIVLGLMLRRPLSQIPENALKMLVGIMLMSLGTVWTGEGVGMTWPFGDWAIALVAALYCAAAFGLIAALNASPWRTKSEKAG